MFIILYHTIPQNVCARLVQWIGLATIYLINAVLAVFAFMEAPSRNQPSILWGMKTFAVGGIAYDQLMQIPTPDELAERARKEEELLQRRQGRRGKRQK